MNDQTDQQLLRDYAERQSEAAFAAVVQRYVDLVYSAAFRMVCDAHAAKDVTQGVFITLAQNARQLTDRPALAGWLHGTARNLAVKTIRSDVRRRAREQEAAVMNEILSAHPDASWEHIAPHLDDALGELSEPDRDAVLLRYFKNHDLRTVGATLGISEDAAQKRVSRAVERLREFFAKRGVTIGASALAVVISANAVQAAPVGLALTISTAAALAGTTLATTATVTATKAIAMTALQKTIVTATIAVLAGAGIYEARQASQLGDKVQMLLQQQAPLLEQVEQLRQALTDATNRVAGLSDELVSAKKNNPELLKLRGEVGVLRAQLADANNIKSQLKQPPLASARAYYDRAGTHYINHDYEAQLEDLDKAIELDPNMAEAYFMRGNLYASNLPKHRGGYEKAIADYTRCLAIKPNDAGARWNRAMHYPDIRRYDEAIADWAIYIEGDTDFSLQGEGKTKSLAGAYFYRARVYQQNKKDYPKAIADYTAALELNPSIESAHRQRGKCYELIGEMDKAQQDFAIEPKN
ncbi:MAG: sigma-70 family RNA polymerase sigma factor [Verrucomicrobia bacterium]|nr:sigma-70 family RNA polymerase sigma factor [Verrucomicrobiota bacterium]